MAKKEDSNNINIINRKASHEFEFLEKVVCGMVLTGTEIKSIRNQEASLQEAYCYIHEEEMFVKSMYIGPYEQGNINNHEPRRERKLLLKKREIKKFENKLKDQGLTVVPVRLFVTQKGWAKLEIALAKGKKLYDKRQDLKKKDMKREIDRELK